MRNQTLLCGALLLLLSSWLQAQDLRVESFARLERDLLARTSQRLDRNDVPCAALRISVANAKSFTFAGNIIGDVVYLPGEAIVYLTDRTRKIRISSDKFGSLDYEFPERVLQSVTYRLKLRLVEDKENKIRTLVMPVVGIGETFSYGAMIGVVKKTGAYIKVKYNFQELGADYECDNSGVIVGTESSSWFTGDNKYSRFAITGGLLQRLWKPAYLYVGAGYGYKKLGWELEGGEWAENTDKSTKGVEAELGAILRLKNIAFSVGVQSNSFEYWEATVGIGIMF